jgi:CDP-glucose 4,6-dehydratase
MSGLQDASSYWKDRPVFVTGGTGLLGGWLIAALRRSGADVVALVRDFVPECMLASEGWMRQIKCVNGSLLDADLLRRTLAEYSIDTVFHLGAQTLVGVAKVDPTTTLDVNIRGTWQLLEAARSTKTPRVLVASSDKAYGESTRLPYHEDDPLAGRYPYDVSKSCADLISTMYARTYGLNTGIVRCGNLFGGGDLNYSRLIPGVIQAALRNEQFRIRSDGKPVRDFLYVEDAVDAYLCLGERLAADPSLAGQAFNFGLGLRLTMLELAERVLAMMGRSDLPVIVENIASAEIKEQYLSADKAAGVLAWAPRFGMDEGLRRTIDWYTRAFETAGKALAVGIG